MERVKQFYQIVLLGEEYILTAEEFNKLQEECREIAGYKNCSGKCHQVDHDTKEFDHVADEPDPLVELNPEIEFEGSRFFLLTKSPHKAIQAQAQQAAVLSEEIDQIVSAVPNPDKFLAQPIDADVVKNKVSEMARPKKAPKKPIIARRGRPGKDLSKYAAMIQEGEAKEAIQNQMVTDGFCKQVDTCRYYKKAETVAHATVERVIRPEDATDSEVIDVMAMARNKFGLDWDDSGSRIWRYPEGMTEERVKAGAHKDDKSNAWEFYQATHKGVKGE